MSKKNIITATALTAGILGSFSLMNTPHVFAQENKNYSQEEIHKQTNTWIQKLSLEEKNSVESYLNSNNYKLYNNINEYLNTTFSLPNSTLEKHINNLDSALKKNVVQEDLILYKKTNLSELNINNLTKNTDLRLGDKLNKNTLEKLKKELNKKPVLQYKSYLTTDLNQNKMFSATVPVFLEIKVPSGSNIGIHTGIKNNYGKMSNILIPRNSSFKIQKIEVVNLQEDIMHEGKKIEQTFSKEFIKIHVELIK